MANPSSPFEKFEQRNPSAPWRARLTPLARRALILLEKISLRLEQPFAWLTSDPRFNPLYHTGTITIFLLLVILFTGIYLTMFYPFGFSLSYAAVANIESNFVGRIMRALHRYASDAAVIFALLHGWRTFFQDRFRGPRWLAWLTGVGMAFIVWFIGITGYWLLWDSRAQVLNQTLFDMLDKFRGGQTFLVDYVFGAAASTGWGFMFIMVLLHVGLSALTAFLLWKHLSRLSRPKWTPPAYWMALSGVVLLAAAIFFPLGILPPLDAARLPQQVSLDSFFLFYLSTFLSGPQALFWIVLFTLLAAALLLPWLMPRNRHVTPVQIDLPLCDGCTLCERDCPYAAITMIPRADGGRPKLQAQINPQLCVSCGVCIGSCPENALSFEQPIDALWQTTLQTVAQNTGKPLVFVCERHALMNPKEMEDALVVPLTCIAMANPNLAAKALQAGASEVRFVGCPPEDCANREGNLWMDERLRGERLPKLKSEFRAAVSGAWLPPTQFKLALRQRGEDSASAYRLALNFKHARQVIALLLVMALVTAAQLWLSARPTNFFPAETARLTLEMTHHSGYPLRGVESVLEAEPNLTAPIRVVTELDGAILFDETYAMTDARTNHGARIFQRAEIPVGQHHLRITLYDRADSTLAQTLLDENVTLTKNQILNLSFQDLHYADAKNGELLYNEEVPGVNAGCKICHSLEKDVRIVGPSFYGVADRAAQRVPGLSAEEYLRQSILQPNAYVVPDFPKGVMVQNFSELLTENQVEDLIAFLMTLKEGQ